jgi:hypothetical protein
MGRWRKGHSGNPKGNDPGFRWRTTRLAEELLLDQASAITTKLIERAMGGDPIALRLAVERYMPVARDRSLRLKLPPVTTAEEVSKAIAAVAKAMAEGEISPLEAQAATGVLEAQRRGFETLEQERRIAELEQAAKDSPRYS